MCNCGSTRSRHQHGRNRWCIRNAIEGATGCVTAFAPARFAETFKIRHVTFSVALHNHFPRRGYPFCENIRAEECLDTHAKEHFQPHFHWPDCPFKSELLCEHELVLKKNIVVCLIGYKECFKGCAKSFQPRLARWFNLSPKIARKTQGFDSLLVVSSLLFHHVSWGFWLFCAAWVGLFGFR